MLKCSSRDYINKLVFMPSILRCTKNLPNIPGTQSSFSHHQLHSSMEFASQTHFLNSPLAICLIALVSSVKNHSVLGYTGGRSDYLHFLHFNPENKNVTICE